MMERKEIIKNLLLIFSVGIVFALCAIVLRTIDPELFGSSEIFLRSAFFVIVTSMAVKLIVQIYGKPLTQEMKEEENREAEQKDEKQVLFKPTTGFIIFLLFLIFIGVTGFFMRPLAQDAPAADVFAWFLCCFFMTGLGLYFWYKLPVFIFAQDSVQIKPHLFYSLGIGKNTVIRYADITLVSTDRRLSGNQWGVEPKHGLILSMHGAAQLYGLFGFDDEIIAKIYLRFKEKLGDKVELE